jgi:hypothetical protein
MEYILMKLSRGGPNHRSELNGLDCAKSEREYTPTRPYLDCKSQAINWFLVA